MPGTTRACIHIVFTLKMKRMDPDTTFEPYIGAENLSRYPEQQPSEVIKKLSQLYNISTG